MKKIIIVFSFILVVLSILYYNKYSSKNFNTLLKLNNVKQIEFVWKDNINIVEDPKKIQEVIDYLNSFEYIRKPNQEVSQENIDNNSYSLLEVWFIKSKSEKISMSFYNNELRSGTTFYFISDGNIDESIFKSLLSE